MLPGEPGQDCPAEIIETPPPLKVKRIHLLSLNASIIETLKDT